MSKIKAKLTAFFVAVACLFVGVGVVFLQQRKANITAKAATAEELTAEFTNNGQFVLEQDTITNHTPTILEGTAVTEATLPDGYKGAVLQAHRSSSTDGWDAVRFNFTAAQIKAADVSSIVIRVWVENFNSETDEIRVMGANGTTRQYGVGKFDLSTWCDVPLKVNSIADMTDENGYLSVTEFRLRDKPEASHLYIDSVTVNLTTEFTDNSQFTVSPYSENMSISYQFDESLPSGWSDTVMRIKTYSGQAYVNLDFSKAQLKASTVESISVRAYSPDYTGEDEFRFNNASVAGNIGKYDMSTWCDIPVDISKIQTDENGYLTTITVGLRDKGTLSTYFYIDSITVKKVAYTTYEMGALSVRDNVSTNKRIYANTANYKIAELPFQSWTDLFEFESGSGLKINGETAAMGTMYSSDNGITFTFPEVTEAGTVVSIGGTFTCATKLSKYVIEDSSFIWDGAKWANYVPVEKYELGTLTVHPHSAGTTTNTPKATALYLKTDIELPFTAWSDKFNLESGDGWKLNGNAITPAEFISADGNLFVNLTNANVQVGDVLSVSGTFVHTTENAKYVIAENEFVWNGTTWEVYVPYTTYNLDGLKFRQWDASKNHMYILLIGDWARPDDGNGGWTADFLSKNGVGVMFGENKISTVRFPGEMFIELGSAPAEGDVLTVGGTFYNASCAVQYVIPESKFVWNGTTWENYVEPASYELGVLTVHAHSAGTTTNTPSATSLYLKTDIELPFTAWTDLFDLESGDGWKLNGSAITPTQFISAEGRLFVNLADANVQVGDRLSVSGTFVHQTQPVIYVIEESEFVWTSTKWEVYVEYTTYEMGALTVRNNVSTNKRIYANTANYKIAELPFQSWTDLFEFESGSGLKINGETAAMGTMYSSDNGITFTFPEVTEVGTVLSIGGTFRCPTRQTKYVIEDSAFTWNGQTWEKFVTNDHLEAYDVITIQDIDLGSEVTWEGTVNEVQHQFAPSVENTTNSLVFRFGYNCADTALEGASLRFRLRGSNWTGICFDLKDGKIYLVDAGLSYALASNTDYVIEIGTISMKDGKIWTYIKLNEAMVLSEVITTSQLVDFSDFATTGFTNHVSIYASGIAKTTITDPDGIAVTYVSSAGTHVEKVRKDQLYTLVMGKSEKVFIAWEYNGELYAPGQEFGVVETAITFTAVELDFTMEAGASIRLSPTAEYSGIRFTSRINEAEWQAFVEEYAPESFSYGTLIMPYDYLGYGQKPNLEDFVAGEEVLKIETKEGQSADGYLVMRGAMQKIYEGNYGRLFAGRAYVEITLANGMVLTAYTAFDNEDNVRSIRQVAKEFKADTSEPQSANEFRYHTITDEQRAIVDAYIGAEEILLMNYGVYAANATSIIAWNFPALDAANNYMNDANIAVANTMKEAGIQVIGLTGANLVKMDTAAKIEKTRQIINFFWSQGIGTFAFQSNGGNSLNNSFAQTGYPDFSDCEGFMGFLVWDEPGVDAMDTIATQVAAFEAAYAGTDAIFMGNLLPSYASIFKTNSGYDRAAFKAYLQKYCDVVLSQVSGTKWLSIDTYPIYADKTLVKNFLFDIGTLKTVALENDAHAHVILQAYGHVEGENALRSRIPSEAELRMQAYTAMAFGVDSMSWYTYSPNGHGENDTVVDVNGAITNQDNYNAFKNINAELTAIGKVYNAFAWKGIILGAGNDNGVKIDSWEITKDNDYKAFEMVMGQLGDYELSATDTKHLSSVQTNKTDWNYLMGVMEDAHGNEGYVLCNYNSHEADRAQTITLTFDSNVTEAVIYRGGVAQTVSVTDKTLTVDLATGEGVIILPSKLN